MALTWWWSRPNERSSVELAGGIAAFALRNAKAVWVIVLGLCVWGVVALFTMSSGIYPDVSFPRIVVIAQRGEEPVENMMIGVTRPIEEAVNAVAGLRRLRSKTIRGGSELSLDFEPNTDMPEALAQTRARVVAVILTMPPGVTTTIEQQTPSVFPVLSFNVTIDTAQARGTVRDGADLMQWVQLDLRPRLTRLPDVFMVTVQGADIREVLVEADPRRLAGANLSLSDLVKVVRESNTVSAVGILERDHLQFQLLANNELLSLDQIAELPVATRAGKTIHVRDVAQVSAGVADRTLVVTGNGQNAIVVSLFMRFRGKITLLSDRVKGVVDEITPTLPPGVSISPVYDQAMLVRDSLSGVRDAILVGMILAIAVLWIFLSSWRLTLIAGITIPISVLATFAILWALGQSLNLMSLGGIAVAIGLIIDAAIVVVENIARRIRADEDRQTSIISATREIFGAVVGSSLTTVVVFIPLILLEGIVGSFFRAMAIALAVGILVSMAVSLTLTPIMAAGPIGPRPGKRMGRRWTEALARGYEWLARRALKWRWLAAFLLFAVAAAGAWLAIRQRTGFLPSMDESGFVLDYFMPVGTSLSETDANCRKIEALLKEVPEVRSFSRRTGAELGFFVTEQFTGDFLVNLKARAERDRSTLEVIDDLRKRIAIEVPQIKAEFIQIMQDTINDLVGAPAPIEVKVFGADYHLIQALAERVAKEIEKVPNVVDIASGVSFGSREITYRLDADAVSRAGLTSTDAADQMRAAFFGEQATLLRRGEQLVPLRVRYPDALRRDPTWLAEIPIATSAGRTIPASLISQLDEQIAANELARENQQPVVRVTASLSGRDLGSVARDIRARLEQIPHPRDVRIELAGQVETKERAFENLMLVIVLATGLVFLLLVMQFRSYRLPAIIFLTLPFSQIGGLLALRLTGTELNISAFMGLIMLVGLVVRNGIILIEYTAQLRRTTADTLEEALATAGRIRLRPILMTSLTAIIALLPLALNIGTGAELQRPLAIAAIGGLSVSTLFTLLVIPVAHIILGEPQGIRHDPAEATP